MISRNIFLISLWGFLLLAGGIKEVRAGDLLSSLGLDPKSVNYFIWNDYDLNGAVGDACNSYCSQNQDACDCGPGGCDGNPDQYSNRPLPKTAAGFACINNFIQNAIKNPQTYKLSNACARACTRQACLHDNVQIREVCTYLCCDISQGPVDYLKDCASGLPSYQGGFCGNYLQSQKIYGGKAQTKAMMAPHPLVIRQNNKALRGNAPQTMKGRPVNQNQQSRANTQKSQPHVMPPLNQARKGPQPQPQHHGMIPIDPHHPTIMTPVNQGKTAPGSQHPAAMPVENRGRTTPPRMMPVPHHGGNPSQNMQPHSNTQQHNHSGMMPVPNRGQAASPQNRQQHPGLLRPLPPHLVDIERPAQPER